MPGRAAAVAIHSVIKNNKKSLTLDDADFVKAKGHYLAAIVKLNMRLWNDLTSDDIMELFMYMDANQDGTVNGREFAELLGQSLEPPLTEIDLDVVFKALDITRDGVMTLNELESAMFSGHLKEALGRIHKAKQKADKEAAEAKTRGPAISRDLMAERVEWRVSRDDSFYTLPVTLLFICLFIVVVMTHLQIKKRFRLQKGTEDWVAGYSGADYPGPYLGDHIGNEEQFIQWLDVSGLAMVFGGCHRGHSGEPECPVNPRSLLVGDVKVIRTLADNSEEGEWLLHSPEAEAHLGLTGNSLDYLGAAKKRLDALWRSEWIHSAIVRSGAVIRVELVFQTYNEYEEAFALTSAFLKIDNRGQILADTFCRAVVINPYADWSLWIVDALYLAMVLWSAKVEAEQYWLRGCKGYWDHCGLEGAWNAVDCFGIIMGFLNIVQWVFFVMLVHTAEIRDVLYDVDGNMALMPNAMSMSLSTIEDLESKLRAGSAAYYGMQLAMGTNVLSIIMKLFKAFGANARLQLVTSTLIKASEDLFHFFVVFIALFIGFALTGHILFGEDIEEFRSFPLSVNTAFESLLGDFDWYSDRVISPMELGSGLPYVVVVVWFYTFMLLIVLVMLNMLLAIVMDHYMNLLTKVRDDIDNAPPLWTQSARMYKRWKQQRGWVSGSKILHQVVDLGMHPEEEVTAESLKKAFSQMNDKQIEGLIKDWKKEAWKRQKKEQEEDANTSTLKDIKMTLGDLSDQVRIVTHTTCGISSRVANLEASGMTVDSGELLKQMGKSDAPEEGAAVVGGSQSTEAPDVTPQKPPGYEDIEKLVGDLRGLVGQLQEQQRKVNEKPAVQQKYQTVQFPPPQAPYRSVCGSMQALPPEHQLLVIPQQPGMYVQQ